MSHKCIALLRFSLFHPALCLVLTNLSLGMLISVMLIKEKNMWSLGKKLGIVAAIRRGVIRVSVNKKVHSTKIRPKISS